jgi:hypothetical protein
MNAFQLRRVLRRAWDNRPPPGIAHLAVHLIELSTRPAPGVEPPAGLEVRIAEDFDELPEEAANAFWADALGGSTEDSEPSS